MNFNLIILILIITKLCTSQNFTGTVTAFGGSNVGGACGFKQKSFNYDNMMEVAINSEQWDNSYNCGRCVSISYKNENKIAVITDKCPECKYGDLDLFLQMYSEIIHLPPSREKISWDFIDCPKELLYEYINLRIDFINQHWLSINPEDFKCGIKKMEILLNNNWILLERDDAKMTGLYFTYNSYISMPFQIRITSIYGEILTSGIYDKIENNLPLYKQFSCTNTPSNIYRCKI